MRLLVTGLAASSLLWALPAVAQEKVAAAEPPGVTTEMRARAVFLGLHYDQGTSSAFGLSVLQGWEQGTHHGGLGFLQWAGIGVDGRVVTSGHPKVEGMLGYAVGRWSAVGCAGGFGLELAGGVAHDAHRTIPALAPAVFVGAYFLELGYSYQFPVPPSERPEWLSSHQFSVRIHIPLRYEKREWVVASRS